jgi:hypothetical protein
VSPIQEGEEFNLSTDTTLYANWAIPEAARLFGLGEEQKVSVVVGNIRGLTTDGDSIFYVASNDTEPLIRRVDFSGTAETSITVTGVGAATVLGDVRSGQRDLAYSSGHIFVRENGSAGSKLFAISVTTGALTEVSLPAGKPFFEGQAWLRGNLIDFPDGRVGAVSKNRQDLTGTGLVCPDIATQCKVLRLYNIDVSSGVVTATFSEDILLADDDARVTTNPAHCWVGSSYTVAGGSYDGWPCDDHGIATDGTYLYQSHHSRGYKVWGLQSGGLPSYVVFNADGSKTDKSLEAVCGAPAGVSGGLCPISGPYTAGTPANFTLLNATYFTRDHKGNRYLMGDFGAGALLITKAATPPPGPGTQKSVSPPRSVVATAGDTQVSLSWEEPTVGAPILDYTVTVSPGGATCTTATRTCVISGLTNDTAYTFSVVARNADGESAGASAAATPVAGNGGEDNSSQDNSGGNQNQSNGNQNQSRNQNGNQNQSLNILPGGGSTPSVPPGRTQPARPPGQTPVTPPSPALAGPVTNLRAGQESGNYNRSFVGGQEVQAQFAQQGERGVVVRSSGFEMGVQVASSGSTNQFVSNPTAASPALSVSPGETLAINASRLMPGSIVQVWAVGANGQPELGRARVGESGTVDTRMSFLTGDAGATLAIGPRMIQVTATNADGEPVVVELAVYVPQGPLKPERYRELNQLPQLGPGQHTGTSAGKMISLTLTPIPEQSRLLMSAEDWVFTLDVSGTPQQRVDGGQNPGATLTHSGTSSLSGVGLMPGTTLSVWLFSDPTLVTTAVVDDAGAFSVDMVVDPALISAGEHTLQIQGVGPDGFIKAANLGVTVLASNSSVFSVAGLWTVGGLLTLLVLVAIVMIGVVRRHRSMEV